MEKSVVGTKKKMDDNGVSMTTVTADYEQFGFNDEQEKAKKKKNNKDATLFERYFNCKSCLLCTKKEESQQQRWR